MTMSKRWSNDAAAGWAAIHRPAASEIRRWAVAVTAKARRRISRAAALWVAAHPAAAGFEQRFDVVLTVPRRWPRHLIGAFGEGGRSWPT